MKEPSPSSNLLTTRRFLPFFLTQTCGAFNDNVLKNALVILVAFGVAGITAGQVDLYVNLAGGLFILPFFLFSATSGQLAEKYDKATLIRWIKLFEITIMVLAVVGFQSSSIPLLLGALFLMGFHSTLFGPVKYSILPQQLKPEELIAGNAWVEAATFLAILLGTMLGGFLMTQVHGASWVGAALVTIAVLGYLASRGIPHASAAAPDLVINWNVFTETGRNIAFLRTERTVFLSVLGISWFWFFGVTFLAQLPNYTKLHLGGNGQVVTALLTVFSFGIGIGSLLCERLSGHRVEIGLVPLGSIGLTVFGIDLYFASLGLQHGPDLIGAGAFLHRHGTIRILADLSLIGVAGGLFIVPLYALIQTRTEPSRRSRVIAGNNILNAAFMVTSAILSVVALKVGLTIPELLLTTALMNAAVAVFIYALVPEFLMRFVAWMMIRVLYRIKVSGLENIPEDGPAIVVCNHVSFVDALIVGGSVRRPLRFVMYHKIFRIPVMNFLFRTARAIPIAPMKEDPEMLKRAYEEIDAALKRGEIIGLFPEGGLTPDGEIKDFKTGVERILERTPVPVVPMAVRGLWGSMWSRLDSKLRRARLPRRFRARIELIAEPAIPAAQATAAILETRVRELRGTGGA